MKLESGMHSFVLAVALLWLGSTQYATAFTMADHEEVSNHSHSNSALHHSLIDILDNSEYLRFISESCLNRSKSFVQEPLKGTTPWIWQMIDASARAPSDLLDANLVWMGSYDECISINYYHNESAITVQGKYCEIEIPLRDLNSTDDRMNVILEEIASKVYPGMPMSIFRGICIPNACSTQDLRSILDAINKKSNSSAHVTDCFDQTSKFDTAAIVVIAIWSTIATILVAATVYDLAVQFRKWWGKLENMASQETQSILNKQGTNGTDGTDNRSFCGNLLMVFSMYKNGCQMLSTKGAKKGLTPLNGIRFFSIVWVVLIHSYFTGSIQYKVWDNYNDFEKMYTTFIFQIVVNGHRAVDTFLFLSGLLVTYVTLRELRKTGGKWNPIKFYIHRYWRLVPPYAMTIAWVAGLSTLIVQGPLLGQSINERDNCRANWWRNLLFIQNFGDTTHMCMGHSWYLAVDFQLYVFSPLVLYPLYKKPIFGILLLALLTAASCTASGVITYLEDLPVQQIVNVPALKALQYSRDYYIKPYCRVGPYAVGMFIGYILQNESIRVAMRPLKVCVCWCVAIVCNLAILFGAYDHYLIGRSNSVIARAFFNALSNTVWAASLAWVTYACVRGYGGIVNKFLSLSIWLPLGRLAYCIYLLHFEIEISFHNSRKNKFHMDQLLMVTLFLGFLLMSIFAAALFSLAFEVTTMKLEEFILGKRHREATVSRENGQEINEVHDSGNVSIASTRNSVAD